MVASPEVTSSPPNPALAGGVTVSSVEGGSETLPVWESRIANGDLRTALTESLRQAGLLAGESQPPRYEIRATLVNRDKTSNLFDPNFTVELTVRYVLVPAGGGDPLLDEQVTTEHRATMKDTFIGAERMKLANEGAARKSIEAVIRKLNALRLKSVEVS